MEQIENVPLDFEFLDGGVTPVNRGNDTGRRRFPFHVLVCNDGMSSRAERETRVTAVSDGEGYLIRKNELHRLRTREGEHPCFRLVSLSDHAAARDGFSRFL